MEDVVVGLLAIVAGVVFCFRGYLTMRVVVPIWGALAGFMFGAGLVSSFGSDGFLRSVLGWIVGVVVAVVFALLAYTYYEVSVLIAMAAIGFALGTTVMVAIGVSWTWLIVLAGLAAGTLLALFAIVADMPMVLLTVLTALAGASAIVFGVMLLTGVVETADFESVIATKAINDDWWWYLIYGALAVAGVVTQMRSLQTLRQSLRDSWTEAGGHSLRSDSASQRPA